MSYTKLVVVCVAALCLGSALAYRRPRETDNPIEDLLTQAGNTLEGWATQMRTLWEQHAPNQETVVENVKNQTAVFAEVIGKALGDLQAKSAEATEQFQQGLRPIIERLEQTKADLQAQYPDASQQAEQVQQRFQAGLQQASEQVRTLQNTLSEQTGPLRQEISNIAQSMSQKIKEAADKAQEVVQQHIQQAGSH